MKKQVIIILILTGLAIRGIASTITGKVTCQMERKPIPDALIILQKRSDPDFSRTTVSDKTGQFTLTNVEPGVYNIEAVREGYFKNVLFDLKIEADRNYEINIKLLKQEGKSSSDYCFMLGGIEVYSVQKELIPESPVTTRPLS